MEIISKEMIKPSFPTPKHLRFHKLSLLDQLAPSIYIPLIFFYQPVEQNNDYNLSKISQSLKQSLSNTLTKFYPLAGRIDGINSVDCNDVGVEYVETRVQARLDCVIERPCMEELKKFLPREPRGTDNVPLSIQVNFFACGGVAIGACISHKVADGSSLVNFMNGWAVTCRRGENSGDDHRPAFDSNNLFPARDLPFMGSHQSLGITGEKIVTKRFVFDKEKLEALKKGAWSSAGDSQVKNPSRVECVTAFMWSHFMEVGEDQKLESKSFAAVHAVNLRPRIDPPLQDNSFGNIWTHTLALSTPGTDQSYHHLVWSLRDAIRNINTNYVKTIQQGDEYLISLTKFVELFRNKDIEFCNFSSWVRFPLYEVDYGWGKPVWVSTVSLPFRNLVILMSTPCGQGIEAWVNMLEEDDDASMSSPLLKKLQELSIYTI